MREHRTHTHTHTHTQRDCNSIVKGAWVGRILVNVKLIYLALWRITAWGHFVLYILFFFLISCIYCQSIFFCWKPAINSLLVKSYGYQHSVSACFTFFIYKSKHRISLDYSLLTVSMKQYKATLLSDALHSDRTCQFIFLCLLCKFLTQPC